VKNTTTMGCNAKKTNKQTKQMLQLVGVTKEYADQNCTEWTALLKIKRKISKLLVAQNGENYLSSHETISFSRT
jgi:hypothetical protein